MSPPFTTQASDYATIARLPTGDGLGRAGGVAEKRFGERDDRRIDSEFVEIPLEAEADAVSDVPEEAEPQAGDGALLRHELGIEREAQSVSICCSAVKSVDARRPVSPSTHRKSARREGPSSASTVRLTSSSRSFSKS
jgi:hypothetical protein